VRRLRTILLTVIFAVGGAIAGRMAANAQRRAAGDDRPAGGSSLTGLNAQAVIPGLIAAMRVGERPWSLLHIPPWLAAGSINFVVAMFTSASPDDGPDPAPPARTIVVEELPAHESSPQAEQLHHSGAPVPPPPTATRAADPSATAGWRPSASPITNPGAPAAADQTQDEPPGGAFTRFTD